MVARRKTTTIKKPLKTPLSISEQETPAVPEAPPETLTADTQMPESQPFEVKVEVETQSPTPEVQNPRANQVVSQSPQPDTTQTMATPLSQPPAETISPAPVSEKSPAPENVSEVGESQPAGSGKKWLWVILILIVLLFVGGAIYTYTKTMKGLGGSTSTPVPEVAIVTPSPIASSSAQLSRGDLKVQVLNGTSVVGLAARAKAYLEGLGYKNVTVSNADENDLTETTIAIKDSKKDYLDLLSKDITPKYALAKASKTLDSSSSYDVVVTLGQP